MELGAFSVSLSVKDLEASKSFYEKLGFQVFGGDAAQNWLVMKNGDHGQQAQPKEPLLGLLDWFPLIILKAITMRR